MTPHLTREQVRRIDQLAVERYCMTGLVLMENAGRNAASIMDHAYGPWAKAIIFCGTGNNGGDGCVIARHLHNARWRVRLVMAGDPSRMTPDTRANHAILEAMNVEMVVASDRESQRTAVESIDTDAVVVDALLGTGFRGEVRSPTETFISALNDAPRQAMVAIDVPSGLDCDSGSPSNATITADLTITFAAEKIGFANSAAAVYTGRIELADIGVPKELLDLVADEPS